MPINQQYILAINNDSSSIKFAFSDEIKKIGLIAGMEVMKHP